MSDMSSKFITNLLLRVYFAAFAALPLSYMHIDAGQESHALAAANTHRGHDIHLLLHRIFSAHLDNRSDHCIAQAAGLSDTTSRKSILKFLCPVSPPAALASAGTGTTHVPDDAASLYPVCNDPRAASGIRPLSSGLSPPSLQSVALLQFQDERKGGNAS